MIESLAALLAATALAAPAQDDVTVATAVVPAEREMSTDRPDTTESPYTVPKGRVQVEMSFAQYAVAGPRGARERTLDIVPINLKFGLTDAVDLQLVATPHTRVRAGGATVDGFSDDTQIRLKVNLWGNDGGRTALAVMPFVKLPTGAGRLGNGRVEGGLIVPLAIKLPGEFDLGIMAEFDLVYDEERRDYGVDVVHSATVGHALVGKLSGYAEYVGAFPRPGGGGYRAEASGGLVYELTDEWTLDAGGKRRLSGDVDRFTLFAGTSFRF